jgi:hypothetical protein
MVAETVSDVLIEIASPHYEKLIPRYHAFLCELNVLRTGLAVILYQRERKRLPDDLGQLVPSYISAVPQDSFNGFKPMRYVKKGNDFKVYSFGPDDKDAGGSTNLDWEAYTADPSRNAGDIVFSN